LQIFNSLGEPRRRNYSHRSVRSCRPRADGVV
jgi:hypothetical protein